MILQYRFVPAFADDVVLFPQADQLLIVVKNGIAVFQAFSRIDFFIVPVDFDPGHAVCKAGILLIAPLHGSPAVVAGPLAQHLVNPGFLHSAFLQNIEIMQAFHITVLIGGGKTGVSHAQFLPLVDIGRSPHAVDGRRQHLGRLLPVSRFVPEP